MRLKRMLLSVALGGLVVMGASPQAWAYDLHLCGTYGTNLQPQEWCPGYSPRHSWRWATGYRSSSSGIQMCVIVNNSDNRYMFSRCDYYATSIYVPPRDFNYGSQLTRVYNKNNNVFCCGAERRYLYATT